MFGDDGGVIEYPWYPTDPATCFGFVRDTCTTEEQQRPDPTAEGACSRPLLAACKEVLTASRDDGGVYRPWVELGMGMEGPSLLREEHVCLYEIGQVGAAGTEMLLPTEVAGARCVGREVQEAGEVGRRGRPGDLPLLALTTPPTRRPPAMLP